VERSLPHFKYPGRIHPWHSLELEAVNFRDSCSRTSSDGADFFGLARLGNGWAVAFRLQFFWAAA
ncbi:unnamed protein product, partial [Ceratitis capitata]